MDRAYVTHSRQKHLEDGERERPKESRERMVENPERLKRPSVCPGDGRCECVCMCVWVCDT